MSLLINSLKLTKWVMFSNITVRNRLQAFISSKMLHVSSVHVSEQKQQIWTSNKCVIRLCKNYVGRLRALRVCCNQIQFVHSLNFVGSNYSSITVLIVIPRGKVISEMPWCVSYIDTWLLIRTRILYGWSPWLFFQWYLNFAFLG